MTTSSHAEKLASERAAPPASPEKLLAKRLKETFPSANPLVFQFSGQDPLLRRPALEKAAFHLFVPDNFSRSELQKLGFSEEDTNAIDRENLPQTTWVVGGVEDLGQLDFAGIWPKVGDVEAKGFGSAMPRNRLVKDSLQGEARGGYVLIEQIAPSALPPIFAADSKFSVQKGGTLLTIPEEMVRKAMPDIFPAIAHER